MGTVASLTARFNMTGYNVFNIAVQLFSKIRQLLVMLRTICGSDIRLHFSLLLFRRTVSNGLHCMIKHSAVGESNRFSGWLKTAWCHTHIASFFVANLLLA